MSADHETEHYKAYYHYDEGYFAVFQDNYHLGNFSPEEVAELAEIAADFAADEEDAARDEDEISEPRIIRDVELIDLILDPSASPGPGCTSPQLAEKIKDTDPRAMVGGKILGVTQDARGLNVTVRLPEEQP